MRTVRPPEHLERIFHLRNKPAKTLLLLGGLVAFVGALKVIDTYGGGSYLPELFAGFGATLAAFVIALAWEREREFRQAREEERKLRERVAEEEQKLLDRLATEVRRRFKPIEVELSRDLESLETLRDGFEEEREIGNLSIFHPELLEGAWNANASRLTELVADYELISDLASTYGRIEELRWRLRERTSLLMSGEGPSTQVVAIVLGDITKPLVKELHDEVSDLLARVGEQIAKPDVQPLGLLHKAGASLAVEFRLTPSGEEG